MINDSARRARICGLLWQDYPLACLAISVGKSVHEGEDLKAAVAMLEATRKPCIVRVSDTLQRHNLMSSGMDVEEAWTVSRKSGTEWLERNARILAQFSVAPVIIRWDQVLRSSLFDEVYAAFVRLAQESLVFRSALQRDVDRFMARRSFASREEAAIVSACSRSFLLEEIAGQTILGRQYAYARFYPGKPAEALELVRDGRIPGVPDGLGNTAFVRYQIRTCGGRAVEGRGGF
jgi:hypothetical protein